MTTYYVVLIYRSSYYDSLAEANAYCVSDPNTERFEIESDLDEKEIVTLIDKKCNEYDKGSWEKTYAYRDFILVSKSPIKVL